MTLASQAYSIELYQLTLKLKIELIDSLGSRHQNLVISLKKTFKACLVVARTS